MIFPIQILIYCNDNNIFGGKLGIFWGGTFYPSNTLDRTLAVYGDVPLDGVAFSSELLERSRTFSGFGGSEIQVGRDHEKWEDFHFVKFKWSALPRDPQST